MPLNRNSNNIIASRNITDYFENQINAGVYQETQIIEEVLDTASSVVVNLIAGETILKGNFVTCDNTNGKIYKAVPLLSSNLSNAIGILLNDVVLDDNASILINGIVISTVTGQGGTNVYLTNGSPNFSHTAPTYSVGVLDVLSKLAVNVNDNNAYKIQIGEVQQLLD
jgi:hypothetical protein